MSVGGLYVAIIAGGIQCQHFASEFHLVSYHLLI